MSGSKKLSLVVPAYNEAAGIAEFYKQLKTTLESLQQYDYEIVVVDDGSCDQTVEHLHKLAVKDKHLRLICLSRNFGKEIATTAGIAEARGDAIITIDADGQHPVELLHQFIELWEEGNKIVVGVRVANQKEGLVKRYGSKIFYRFFNRVSGIKLTPGSTDFRLIDRAIQQEFLHMPEHNRVTRVLIDWLGYQQKQVKFVANPRLAGEATYSFKKLMRLAIDSVISHSASPLYIAAYLGIVILPLSLILGLFMFADTLSGDSLHLHIRGTAYLTVVILFLVGILLTSQGIIGLYLSHIHSEVKQRPLYIVDKSRSIGL